MTTYNVLVALHVLGVVWWIGGVALVTCVLLPSLQRLPADDRLTGIRRFEHRFAPQARIAVVLVGITGAWMLSVTSWTRAGFSHGWWLDLMLLVWVLFAVMLFIVEPLGLPLPGAARGLAELGAGRDLLRRHWCARWFRLRMP